MSVTSDVLIIGGGVIGLSTAYQLAKQGASTTVVDRGSVGREASWAGAGMLPPGNLRKATTPEARLRSYSSELWPDLSAQLKNDTGIDNGFLRCGAIETDVTEIQQKEWQQEEISFEFLSRAELQKAIPGLHRDINQGVWLKDFCQARNPRHLKALTSACRHLGVRIVEDVEHLALTCRQDVLVEVTAAEQNFSAGQVCVTAGAWTGVLLKPIGINIPLQPVRGQIAQLQVSPLPFSCVLEQGKRYMVPRSDGVLLIGSTEERAGFEKRTTADGVAGLLQFASSLVPELGNAEIVRSWAGLRPGSPDELPFLGRVPEFENLVIGAGHFRSGLQMSPGTGAILADVIMNKAPAISLQGLEVNRFESSQEPV